VSQSSAATVG